MIDLCNISASWAGGFTSIQQSKDFEKCDKQFYQRAISALGAHRYMILNWW